MPCRSGVNFIQRGEEGGVGERTAAFASSAAPSPSPWLMKEPALTRLCAYHSSPLQRAEGISRGDAGGCTSGMAS